MAETYHILDLEGLPVQLLATLVFGLRDGSRYKMAKADIKYIDDMILLTRIADEIGAIGGMKDGYISDLIYKPKGKKSKGIVYVSRDEFMKARYGGENEWQA